MQNKKQLGQMVLVSLIITVVACVIMGFMFGGNKKVITVNSAPVQQVADMQDAVFSTLSGIAQSIVSVHASRDLKSYVSDPSQVQAPTAAQSGASLGGASGIIVRKDGYVLTSKHVVADLQAKYEVTLADGRIYQVANVWLDPIFDLAILKIVNASGVMPDDLHVATFAPFDQQAQVGQFVLSIGNVLNMYPNSVSFGIISAKNRSFKINDKNTYVGLYQTDAKTSAGNSGGPLINLQGQIIGLMAAVASGQGMAFALPMSAEFMTTLLGSVEKYQSIVRPLIGVEYVDITPAKKLAAPEGIYITAVLSGLPAAQAGLQSGDIVVAIDKKPITSAYPFLYHIYSYLPNTTISLSIIRGEQTLTIPLTLGQNSQ